MGRLPCLLVVLIAAGARTHADDETSVVLRVLGPDGAPVAGAHVQAVPHGAQDGPRADSDAEGRARLAGLYRLHAYDRLTVYPPRDREDLSLTRYPRWRAADGDIRIRRGWTLRVRVRDDAGAPAHRPYVTVLGGNEPWPPTTERADAEGRIDLKRLPPGPVNVHVSWFAGGKETLGTTGAYAEGSGPTIVTLARGRPLRVGLEGSFGSGGGTTWPMVSVFVESEAGWTRAGFVSGWDHFTEVRGIPVGRAAAWDLRSPFTRSLRAFGLLPPDRAEVTIRWAPTVTLEGALFGVPEGTPVSLRVRSGPVELERITVKAGRFKVDRLPDVPLAVEAEATLANGCRVVGTANHQGGGTVDLRLGPP